METKNTPENSRIEFSLNSVSNMFDLVQQDLFTSKFVEDLKKCFSPLINASVGRYGIDITDMECRVLEVIIHGFTETEYAGNYKSISREDLSLQIDNHIDLKSTKIEKFPRFKFTQSELMERLGIDRNQPGAISRAVVALESLSSKMFTFYYERKSTNEEGSIEVDENGNVIYESVMAQGSLLTLLRVQGKDDQRLKNYEVILNPIFLEERDSQCLLIPSGWRDEVVSVVGKKKTSPVVFKFLIFLRYAHELFLRNHNNPPFMFEVGVDEMARMLKISESVIKNKKRTASLLDSCYSTAKKLGYLLDYKMGMYIHTLTLNEDKYSTKYKRSESLRLANMP